MEQAADVAPVKVVVRAILHVVPTGAEEEDRPTVVSAEDGAHAVVLLEHPWERVEGIVFEATESPAPGADKIAAERLSSHTAQGTAEKRGVDIVREVDSLELFGRLGCVTSGLSE